MLLGMVLLIPGMVNEQVLGRDKPLVLGELYGLLQKENYSRAYELASDYLEKATDREIARLKAKAGEMQLYRYVLQIPARDIEINRRLYEILQSMNPDQEIYRRKYAHYHSLAMQMDRRADSRLSAMPEDLLAGGENAPPADLQALIAEQKVRIGMSMEDVRRSWGQPAETSQRQGGAAPYTQWVYPDWRYVFFENGRCTAFTRGTGRTTFN
ncbi:hypothetical protein DESUT3_05310 [Desulfuromonas versatilis]|uniref:Uncharacterized protein n=1 Tax=Desulfuromonas versatilis TaxID=2802975 RepID=A0ABN6DTJ9_9BACT|nr:DUF2845 domain-containing protein [Desulfuromonas versatilis]BCR03462.1 hypothetical protein DESUT3_05310 [Desulfuromonas versatilis]